MAEYVFISHSSKDRDVAVTTCAWLEERGIRCWIAPRDIRPGANWGGSIVQAIREAKVMILIFSSHANASPQIKREVERAVHFGATVIPMRIEDVNPEDDLEYFLGMPHWLDAFTPPLEKHLDILSKAVAEILGIPVSTPAGELLGRAGEHRAVPKEKPTVPIPTVAERKPMPPTLHGLSPPPLPGSGSSGEKRIMDSLPLPNALSPPPLPSVEPTAEPAPASEATIHEAGTEHMGVGGGFAPPLESTPVGAFTTSLAATSTSRISVTIPEGFLAAGTPGTLLRLVPVEQLRGKPPLELYLKTGTSFSLGRSPEADWIACFFPRNEKNDQRSRRLSKVHARIEYREGQLWAHRASTSALHIGKQEVGNNPAGAALRERDQLILAEDYTVEVYYDISLQGTLEFANGQSWQMGRIEFDPTLLGAVRFEPLNSTLAIRSSCWLFVDVGFGGARGGVLTAGSELAPQQGVFLTIGGCFWMLNLVNNEKLAVNDYRPAAQEIIPLTQSDSVWLGATRYRVEIA
jgi:hypothetical protein